MGIRGELYSTKFVCDSRTYFFNVKQNRNGDVFLSIVESKPSEGETFDRRSVVVFGDQMEGFVRAMQSALKYMHKTGTHVEPELDDRGFPLEIDQDRPAPRRAASGERRTSDERPHTGERRYVARGTGDRDRPLRDRPDYSRGDRPARYERSDRSDRPDRTDRGDRPFRAERSDRPYRSDRSDRSDRERAERPRQDRDRPDAARPGAPKPVKRIIVRKPKSQGEGN